jgi:hypothetical protein
MIRRGDPRRDVKGGIAVRIAEPEKRMPGILIAHVPGLLQKTTRVVVIRPFLHFEIVDDTQFGFRRSGRFHP